MIDKNRVAPDLSLEEPIEKIILRSMAEGVITVECNGDIHTANPAALRILGLDEKESVGQKFDSVFSDPENAAFKDIFARVQMGVGTLHEETRFKRRDGQTVDLSVATSFLQVDDCVPGRQSVAIVFRDITAFKALERVKRRAVNHLSHELKTPLAIIKASTENLAQLNQRDPKSTKSLDRIVRNLQRLSDIQALVEEILSPPEYKPQAFPILPFMTELLDDIKERSRHRSVELISRIGNIQTEDLDPNILRMIIETLVKNAVENTPDGGEVTVSMQQNSDGILLQVSDQGVGIPLEDQRFIFEGFHHTQATEEYSTKKPFDFNAGGKGLELLRLKALAELGYFEIAFESSRCKYVPTSRDHCPGVAMSCAHMQDVEGCRKSGGTTFSVLFRSGIDR